MAEEMNEQTTGVTEESAIENFTKVAAEVDKQVKEGAAAPDKDTLDKSGKVADEAQQDETGGEASEGAEASEGSGETDESAAADEEMSEEDTEILNGIDPDVIDACRASNWDDKRIVEEAKTNPAIFSEIRELLDEEQYKKAEQPAQSAKKEEAAEVDEIDAILAKLDPDIHGAEIVKAFQALAGRQKEGHKALTEEQKRLEAERQAAFGAKIDNMFDGHAKSGYKELGNSTVRLGYKEKELRQEVFAVANALALRAGKPVESMINRAVGLFRNQGGEKAAAQKIITKLNQQDKRTINRPTRRISQQQGERKFADNYEEAEYIMTKAEQEAGLTT